MTGGDLDRRGKGEVVKNASGRGMILIERVRNHNIRHRSRTLWITNPTQIHLQHNLWNLNVLPTPERSCSAAEKLASRLVSDHDYVGLRHQTQRLPVISLRVELHESGNRGDSATQGIILRCEWIMLRLQLGIRQTVEFDSPFAKEYDEMHYILRGFYSKTCNEEIFKNFPSNAYIISLTWTQQYFSHWFHVACGPHLYATMDKYRTKVTEGDSIETMQ
nr:testis-expressed sequence 10 protein homolog [Ipomoea batatas]